MLEISDTAFPLLFFTDTSPVVFSRRMTAAVSAARAGRARPASRDRARRRDRSFFFIMPALPLCLFWGAKQARLIERFPENFNYIIADSQAKRNLILGPPPVFS